MSDDDHDDDADDLRRLLEMPHADALDELRTRMGATGGAGKYYKTDEAGQPVLCADILEWSVWMQSANRHVSQDLDEGLGGERVRVSTVFLGLDHNFTAIGPPVLWETLVFGGPMDGEMTRYRSLEAAIAGHQEMCLRVRSSMTPQ